MSFAVEPLEATPDTSNPAYADEHLTIVTKPSDRADRCTVSVLADSDTQPGAAEVTLALVEGGLHPIAVICGPGVTRATLPAGSEDAAVQALHDALAHAA